MTDITTQAERDGMIRRIRALLAQAESTTFEGEAETFMAKAHELMDRYRIAVADVSDTDGPRYAQTKWPLYESRHLRASLQLLAAIAKHYGVVVLVAETGNSKWPTLIGDPVDLEAVSMMFTSLVTQRDRFVLSEPVPAGIATTRFRNSFCYGYASRIAARLSAIRATARTAATATADTTALAVYDRLPAVRAFVVDALGADPTPVSHSKQKMDADGYVSGHHAGGRADLGGHRIGNTGPSAIGQGR